MDAVYPAAASALARGRRLRGTTPRARRRTTPVTFAEIKEVDEESAEAEASEERRRRPDVLEERLDRQFAEFRRRRAARDLLREREPPAPPAPPDLLPPDLRPPDLLPPDLRPPDLLPPDLRPPDLLPPDLRPPEVLPRAGSEPAALHQRDATLTEHIPT